MASSPLFPILITLTTFLILTTPHRLLAQAATPVAPGPTPAPLNLTAILAKGGQYTTFMRLLEDTQVGVQIQSQLNDSFNGLTIFAPTDNAFNNLKPGTLNSLTSQEQVALVLYHVLPRYYSIATFQTASNPVPTQASGHDGVYTLNVTSTTNQVNVSTGVDETRINNELHSDFPLAVYSVDEVLLPYDLFGAKPPASAPAPNSAKEKPEKSPVGSSAEGPSSVAASSPSAATSLKGRGFDWSFVAVIGLMGVGSLL